MWTKCWFVNRWIISQFHCVCSLVKCIFSWLQNCPLCVCSFSAGAGIEKCLFAKSLVGPPKLYLTLHSLLRFLLSYGRIHHRGMAFYLFSNKYEPLSHIFFSNFNFVFWSQIHLTVFEVKQIWRNKVSNLLLCFQFLLNLFFFWVCSVNFLYWNFRR